MNNNMDEIRLAIDAKIDDPTLGMKTIHRLDEVEVLVGDERFCAQELVKKFLMMADLHPKYDKNGYCRDDVEF